MRQSSKRFSPVFQTSSRERVGRFTFVLEMDLTSLLAETSLVEYVINKTVLCALSMDLIAVSREIGVLRIELSYDVYLFARRDFPHFRKSEYTLSAQVIVASEVNHHCPGRFLHCHFNHLQLMRDWS